MKKDLIVSKIQIMHKAKSEDISKFFTYTRSRIRIARSFAFNFGLLTVVLIVFFIRNHDVLKIQNPWLIAGTFTFISGLLCGFAFWSWQHISRKHHDNAALIWEGLKE